MRKLYAILAGLFFCLAGSHINAQTSVCSADFERLNVSTTNDPLVATFKALPWHIENKRPAKICWIFGDGKDTCITYSNTNPGPYIVTHRYELPGTYQVCVKITYVGGCEASKCKPVVMIRPDSCRADFERVNLPIVPDPGIVTFKALPWHNNNKKPTKICWIFGDGKDTCINYPSSYSGPYLVHHRYLQPGNYQVCVKITYAGGCEAGKCKAVQVVRPDSCRANFERVPVSTTNDPLRATFRALPWHNNNKKPQKICWDFGDGTDTCITYPANYTGQYLVRHRYAEPGLYEVCVKIDYFGGCDARKCKPVRIGPRPDTCRADFVKLPLTTINNPLNAIFKALPEHNNGKKPQKICWEFGDGRDTCINYPNNYDGQYLVHHRYEHPGIYEVCIKITYYGGCEARKCKAVQVGRPDTCRADFERVPLSANANPLLATFKALPEHNNGRKPQKICWQFGDGTDTCINYPQNYTGLYLAHHRYQEPGLYEVCVKIQYYGGCEARKCKPIQVGRPDSCRADFERIPVTSNNGLVQGFRALPWHNNDKKPKTICWRFGDGSDTCINYPANYNGPYTVAHRYPAPGEYEVCVKILYWGGCEARKCKEINVPPPPVHCRVQLFEITPSINSLVRGFFAVPFSNPERKPVRVCWYFGDGEDTCINLDPTVPTPNLFIRHTYPAPGNYRACVRILFQGGCVAEDCDEVIIRNPSNICGGFMVDSMIAPRTHKFKGFSVNNPNDEVISYRWTFGDGTSAVGREVTKTWAHGGTYEVCLTIKTRLGCETRVCKPVRVPGNNTPALHLTPNPVITMLNVQFFSTHTETVNIKIINSMGTVVRNYSRNVIIGSNNWDHNLATLFPGVYSYVVQSPNQLASALFIKQ